MLAVLLAVASATVVSSLPDARSNIQETKIPYTSFQTPTEYRADNDIRTDAVIVYSDDKARIRSWIDKGYIVQTMYGFRTGPEYITDHAEEGQTLADGTILTCGPGSFYMVPTPNRIKAAVDYFTNAIAAGTSAVIPEEPEFFAVTGYSKSFKQAWQDTYQEPWRDPASSIEARYKSERLKARMEYNMVKAIMDSAARQKPSVRRMVACHSPVSYFAWGIIYPHYECLKIPNLQEIVGQVWTGTARTACRYTGEVAERTFENALLEYSSLYNLARGTGKRMWFLMDPLEDNPDRTMEDYHANYERTLVASLMFPGVDAYEVMPWPTRIYGRVPDRFATEIGSIINALQDMHNQGKAAFDTGTHGIATLVADSMGWQRGEPHKSNFDCFYGLTLPLVYKGIPVQVAQLERSPEKDYLKPYKVLLVSYDILKPMKPEYNQALADWVKAGGVLVYFGGADAYNALPEWWTKAGLASPQADLYKRLDIKCTLIDASAKLPAFRELARADGRYRNLENNKIYRFDLEPFTADGNPVYVRFRDACPDDGWGPAVESVKLTVDGIAAAQFRTGTPEERSYLALDDDSVFNGKFRFADSDASWIYKFDLPQGAAATLEVRMGNQFLVEATDQPVEETWRVLPSAPSSIRDKMPMFDVPVSYPLTTCKVTGGELYHARGQMGSVVMQRKAGKGMLVHVGISPAYFASSSEAADLLRSITAYACEKAGLAYNEQDRMGIRRGKYVAMRTFGGEKNLKGAYVDILDPDLPVVSDPVVGPWKCAFYCDVTSDLSGGPKLLYSASRVEESLESASLTRLRLSGPLKTRGAARIYTGGRSVESISPDDAKVEQSGDTILVTYDNKPESIDMQIKWR